MLYNYPSPQSNLTRKVRKEREQFLIIFIIWMTHWPLATTICFWNEKRCNFNFYNRLGILLHIFTLELKWAFNVTKRNIKKIWLYIMLITLPTDNEWAQMLIHLFVMQKIRVRVWKRIGNYYWVRWLLHQHLIWINGWHASILLTYKKQESILRY